MIYVSLNKTTHLYDVMFTSRRPNTESPEIPGKHFIGDGTSTEFSLTNKISNGWCTGDCIFCCFVIWTVVSKLNVMMMMMMMINHTFHSVITYTSKWSK